MNLRRKAVKGVAWTVLQNWGGQAINFVIFSLLARLLGPEAFGLVALATVFISFLQIFLDQGFAEAIIQRQDLDPEHLDTAFWSTFTIGILLTVLSVAAAELIADLFNEPQLTPVLRWLSLIFLINSLRGVQAALFRRKFAFKALAVRSLVAALVGGIVGVSMAFLGFGVWSLVSEQLVSAVVGVLVLWWASDWRPGLKVSGKHFSELFGFGINVVGFNFLDFFNRRADNLLIGYFLGPLALGYYSVAYRVLTVMILLLTKTMTSVAVPTFSRLQGELGRLREAFYTVTQLTSLISFPTFLGMAVLAPELVQLLFGDKWAPSVPVMQALAFTGIYQSVSYFNGSVLTAMGKPSWRLRLNFFAAGINIVAFASVVRWGILAVAVAYVVTGYLLSPFYLWLVRKIIHIDITVYLRQYVAPLSASGVMVVAILGTKQVLSNLVNLPALLATCTVIGGTTYAITILLIAPTLFQRSLKLAELAMSKQKKKKEGVS